MASSVVLEQVQSLVQKIYSGALARTLNEISPAFNLLNERGLVITDRRQELRWPSVKKAFENVKNIKDGQDLPDSDSEEYSDAFLKYKIFIGVVRVGRMAQLGSQNVEEFFQTEEGADLLTGQMNSIMRQMAREIHKQIVAVDLPNADALVGLGEAVGKDDNTYATIDRTANAFWRPYINEAVAVRPLTEDLMRDVLNNITDNRGGRTDEIWAGTTAWHALEDILTPRVQLNNPDSLRGGAQTLWWKGIPVMRMPDMDVNTMYFLDLTSDDGIILKKQHDDDFVTRPESTGSYDDRFSVAGHYQLIVNNPFRQGALKDVE